MMETGTRNVFLQSGPDVLFGMFTAATGEQIRPGVLICPPFGWEDVCSYRSRRQWAAELAASGHPSLRFDLPGSGDSSGSPRDPDRPGAWTRAVRDAAAWLSAQSGGSPVTVIGIGLGGLIAIKAAEDSPVIGDLVLWGVNARGRSLLRELRAFSRLQSEPTPPLGDSDAAADGDMVVNGFLLSRDTLAGLERLEVTSPSVAPVGPRRVMLLERDGMPVDARLQRHFVQQGADVTVAAGTGYGAMMAVPHFAEAPRKVFEEVGEWLTRGTPASPSAALETDVVEQAELPAGAAVVETVVRIPDAAGALFGVLADAPGDLCLVLPSSGAVRRIGPNRMWVELARRQAARGMSVLRLDLEGIGDSDGAEGWGADEGGFYAPRYLEQVRTALNWMEREHGKRRFVLGGLCSAAYWSVQLAAEDPRVKGALAVNPLALVWDSHIKGERLARRVKFALRPSGWRRLLADEHPRERVIEVAGALLARARSGGRGGGSRVDEVRRLFDRVAQREIPVLLLFSQREPLRHELEREGFFEHAKQWETLRLAFFDSGTAQTHTLAPLEHQRRVHAILDEELERITGITSPSAPPAAGSALAAGSPFT